MSSASKLHAQLGCASRICEHVTRTTKPVDIRTCEHCLNYYHCHYLLEGICCQIYTNTCTTYVHHFIFRNNFSMHFPSSLPRLDCPNNRQSCTAKLPHLWLAEISSSTSYSSGYFMEGWMLSVHHLCWKAEQDVEKTFGSLVIWATIMHVTMV